MSEIILPPCLIAEFKTKIYNGRNAYAVVKGVFIQTGCRYLVLSRSFPSGKVYVSGMHTTLEDAQERLQKQFDENLIAEIHDINDD